MFGLIMQLGLAAALLFAAGPLLSQTPAFGLLEGSQAWLLPVSVTHMIALSAIAWFLLLRRRPHKLPVNNVDLGSRISTAGYLHTLIGTSAALLAAAGLDQKTFQLAEVIAPIGSALITSVIGWWIGHEISRPRWGGGAISTERVDEAMQELGDTIQSLAGNIREAGSSLVHASKMLGSDVTGIAARIKAIDDSLVRIDRTASTIANDMEAHGLPNLQRLNKAAATTASELGQAAVHSKTLSAKAKTTNEALADAEALIKAADEVLAMLRRPPLREVC